MTAAACPSRETLHRYSLGLLSDEQSDELAGHLESCTDCQATIVNLEDATDTLIGRLRMPSASEFCLEEPPYQAALAKAIVMPIPSHPAQEVSATPQKLGEYRLLDELGRGGMGRVYKALHTKLDRVVAVKILPRTRSDDPQAISRFEREMKAVGRLAHSNIVQAYDAREIDGTPVLIMEYVDGLDLAEIVRRVGPLPVADACELVRQTAGALQCAHEHGLVHRDIKPSNIMLTRSGEVKLLDLGLARFYSGGLSPFSRSEKGTVPFSGPADEMTGTGQAMGTADYMAPEQASDSRTVDIRADLYSLGCTLYKLLSGKVPFSGPDYRGTLDKLNAHVHQIPTPIGQLVPEVTEQLEKILDRLLAKNPEDRFATPAEVARAIEPFAAESDLLDLIEYAESVPEGSAAAPAALSGQDARAPEPLADSRRWKSLVKLSLLLLLVGGFSFSLGILIRIYKDGRETTVEVPPDSHTVIDKHGNPIVSISPEQKQTTDEGRLIAYHIKDAKSEDILAVMQILFENLPNVRLSFERKKNLLVVYAPRSQHERIQKALDLFNRIRSPYPAKPAIPPGATDEQAIQGTWEVVSSTFNLIRKLPDEKNVPSEQVLKTTKVIITPGTLKIVGRHVTDMAFEYRLKQDAKTKMIDLQTHGTTFSVVSYGIYQLEGNQLKICTSGPRVPDLSMNFTPTTTADVRVPLDAKTLRPMEFWSEFGSGKELLVLRRIGGAVVSDDEKNIQGTWRVEKSTKPGMIFTEGQQVEFFRRSFSMQNKGPKGRQDYEIEFGYALDPTIQPKRIDIPTIICPDLTPVHGIYELKDDQLTIAWDYSSGNFMPPSSGRVPSGFTPGPDTALAVLKRVKEQTGKTPGRKEQTGLSPGSITYTTPPLPTKPPEYRTAKITRGDITATIAATGTIEPEEVVDVSALVSGKIVSLGADPRGDADPRYKGKSIDYGSPVEKGVVLARIDDELLKIHLQREESNYRRAEAEFKAAVAKMELAESQAKRARVLDKKHTIPASELEVAETNSKVARAAVESAQAALEQNRGALEEAKNKLAHALIKSPINGVIISRRVNVGQNVAPTPNALGLFLIAKDLKKMQIWAAVNEADIGRIREGMTARFTVDAFPKEVFQGAVTQIRQDATRSQNAVLYTVVVSFENANRKLLPYLTANVQFEIEARRHVLRVPNEALRWKPKPEQVDKAGSGSAKVEFLDDLDVLVVRGDRNVVEKVLDTVDSKHNQQRGILWVKTEDGRRVRPINVQIGLTDGILTEISGPDVKEGMEVVVGMRAPYWYWYSESPSSASRSTPDRSPRPAAASVVHPATELRALQGPWKVTRVEKGKGPGGQTIGGVFSPRALAPAYRIEFRQESDIPLVFRFREPVGGLETGNSLFASCCINYQMFNYRIDPTATPKTIDLLEYNLQQNLMAIGIYEIDGDRLKIRLAPYLPEVKSNQRSKNFTLGPDSEDVLLLLQRTEIPKAETAVLGDWSLVGRTVDGKQAVLENGRFNLIYNFGLLALSIYPPAQEGKMPSSMPIDGGPYFLDASKQPKRITIFTSETSTGEFVRKDLNGIYQIDGDRLQIAYRKGGPPPEKFESAPDSGVTLLVLQRKEQNPERSPTFP